MSILLAIKRRVEELPLAAYCLVAGVAALIGSFALVAGVVLVAGVFGVDAMPDGPGGSLGVADVVGTLIFAPVVETFLFAGLLKLLSGLGPLRSCVVSAVIWGLAHGLLEPIRFAGSVWSFFVFGFGYLLWGQRSFKHGFVAAAVPHVIVNCVALAIWAGGTG
ncbi:CPBP family glutamic-type intramembrane protease [Luteimonas sp. A277]